MMAVCRCTSCFSLLATVEEFIAHKPGCVADAIAFQAALRSSSGRPPPAVTRSHHLVLDDPAGKGSRPRNDGPFPATSGELS